MCCVAGMPVDGSASATGSRATTPTTAELSPSPTNTSALVFTFDNTAQHEGDKKKQPTSDDCLLFCLCFCYYI
jgi:hypothetical protein